MSADLLTFGEFLDLMLRRKRLTITELASLTHTKSRNSIHRLLHDECGIEIIEAFADKLLTLLPLSSDREEIARMNDSIEVSRYGKNTIKARHILYHLCDDTPNHYGAVSGKLKETFESYRNYKKITIFVYDLIAGELLPIISSFIRASLGTAIHIEHIILIHDDPALNAQTFSAILKLINYKNYFAYFDSFYDSNAAFPLSRMNRSNFMVIEKLSQDETLQTDLISLDQDQNLSILLDNPGNSLFRFYQENLTFVKSHCRPIRKSYDAPGALDKLISICEFLLQLEKTSSDYAIKQNMCFQIIPVDISYQMLKDANYLGYDKDHPKIQKLIQINTERFQNYYHSDKKKVQLYTRRGLIDFAKHHILSDQFYQFRDFTDAEVKYTIGYLLQALSKNPNFQIYLLNDDYKIGNIEYIYYEHNALYLFDSCSGYDEDLDEGIITAKPFLDLFDDFIKNELIPKHTCSREETIAFLEELWQAR